MIKRIIPPKLKTGYTVNVIAPSRSLDCDWITYEMKDIAIKRFNDLGLYVEFSENVYEKDEFSSSSIRSRVKDLHAAFQDKKTNMVIAAAGGFNCNQLLSYLDYDIIQNNPKIVCGFSDITALQNAIFAKTGVVTYSGPSFFSFGEKNGFEHSLEYFRKCCLAKEPFEIAASSKWSNDSWPICQDNRKFENNPGYSIINQGEAKGTIIGGNLGTFNLIQGTEFMPCLKDSILFLEEDYEMRPHHFDRNLQSLIHQPGFEGVQGIVIGRFQKRSEMTESLLEQIILTKKELDNVPVIAGADFGHTTPKITFPIGGQAMIKAGKENAEIYISEH